MTNPPSNERPPRRVDPGRRASASREIHDASAEAPAAGPSRFAGSATVALLGPMLVIALVAVRSPTLLAHGRLWAEETFFLTHTLTTGSFLHQVFFVYRGHLELLTSTVFAVASRLGLEVLPLVTTYAGLLVECVLAFMVVFFRRDLEIRLASALLICILVVVSPCAVENYLNLLNSVWLASAILLLLINLPPQRLANRGSIVVAASLVLGLSGMPATCLMPLALLHAVVWRSRPHLLIAATLTLCCIVQGILVLIHGAHDRFSPVSAWVYVSAPFFHVVVEHLSGVDAASALGHWFKGAIGLSPLPTMMLAPLALLLWIGLHLVRKGETRSKLLLVALVYTAAFNIAFALGDRNDLFTVYAMRYFFVPSFAVALLVARTNATSLRRPPGLAPGLLVLVTLIGTTEFFRNPFYDTYVEPGHDWRQDVEGCRARATACVIEIDPGHVPVAIPDDVLRRSAR